jgi:hypothetical protein
VVSSFPGDPELGLPRRATLRGLRIIGHGPAANEYGLQINGACIRVEDVEILECQLGLALGWAVDVTFKDCVFRKNQANIYSPGSGPCSITTTRFRDCQIREAYGDGVLLQHAMGMTFDGCIVESNAGAGLRVDANTNRVDKLRLRDTWFENNAGGHVIDPTHVATWEGFQPY